MHLQGQDSEQSYQLTDIVRMFSYWELGESILD